MVVFKTEEEYQVEKKYLKEVFGCTFKNLLDPKWHLTLKCIQENADDGYEGDQKILKHLEELKKARK